MLALSKSSLLWNLTAVSSLSGNFASAGLRKRDYVAYDYYAIAIDPRADPQEIAARFNFAYEGSIGQLEHHHLYSTPKSLSLVPRQEDLQERWIGYTSPHQRSILSKRADEELFSRIHFFEKQKLRQRVKRAAIPELLDRQGKQTEEQQEDLYEGLDISDPIFHRQWHLVNPVEMHDVNVSGVWRSGVTGKGVNVAIIDDGLDMDSGDLAANFYAAGSHDFNDHTDLPKPRLSDDTHGTRCAGQIGAVKNDVCGVGVAYDSKVAGLRILSGEVTDVEEAEALNYDFHNNHIYSCSWGPPDDGQSAEAPQGLIWRAILNGIENGRNGKGSIFVFASGNGGGNDDSCNYDGYTNSIYSVTVGAIDRKGLHPYYSEKCSAQLIVSYSSGSGSYISTTDVGKDKCTDRHGGTSAAAPIAAGVFALVLEVRPDLSWRDIQHLCVNTAVKVNDDDEDWTVTHAGRHYNHKFGYGRLDAFAIVEAAKTFKSVKKQAWLENPFTQVDQPIPFGSHGLNSSMTITSEQLQEANLEKLEHVTVTVNIAHQRRGDIEVELISPFNVVSQLAAARRLDASSAGLQNWTFMSVKHWGEDAVGKWTLRVKDENNLIYTGRFLNWTITFWGESRDESLAKPYPLPAVPQPSSTGGSLPTETASSGIASSTTSEATSSAVAPSTSASETSSSASPGSTETPSTGDKEETHAPFNNATTGIPPTQEPAWGSIAHLKSINPIWVVLSFGFVVVFAICGWIYIARRTGKWPFESAAVDGSKGVGDYEFEILHDAEDDDDDGEYTRSGGDRAPLMSQRERQNGREDSERRPENGNMNGRKSKELYDAFDGSSTDKVATDHQNGDHEESHFALEDEDEEENGHAHGQRTE